MNYTFSIYVQCILLLCACLCTFSRRLLPALSSSSASILQYYKRTLPKAQRTRGLSFGYQSNFFRSYHKLRNKSKDTWLLVLRINLNPVPLFGLQRSPIANLVRGRKPVFLQLIMNWFQCTCPYSDCTGGQLRIEWQVDPVLLQLII